MSDALTRSEIDDLKKRKRQSMLNNALGSLAIEGQHVSPHVLKLGKQYVAGKITSSQMIALIKARAN